VSKLDHGKGALVCFEGGDGAGKTTLSLSVVEELSQRGFDLVMVDKKSTEFETVYLSERMRDLRRVLWDYPPDAPLWEWGDHHWFHLIVSWFSVLDRCKVLPLLEEGKVVVVDNWYYKFAARFLLKPEFDRQFVLASFEHLTVPDLVIFVDVDPRVALMRKEKFSATESGRMDGHSKGDADDFVSYQGKVLEQLRRFSDSSWTRFDASQMALEQLVGAVSEVILKVAER
jgi:dTMP kinase